MFYNEPFDMPPEVREAMLKMLDEVQQDPVMVVKVASVGASLRDTGIGKSVTKRLRKEGAL